MVVHCRFVGDKHCKLDALLFEAGFLTCKNGMVLGWKTAAL